MQIKKNKVKADRDSLQVLTRLCAYVIRNYRVSCFFVLIFIIISSLATVASSLFLKSLIDDYIAPILASNGPADFGPLFQALCAMALCMRYCFHVSVCQNFDQCGTGDDETDS